MSRASEGEKSGHGRREVKCKVKSLRSFESCRRDYGSYTAGNGEPLQDFEHGSDLMEHSGSCVKNRLEEGKSRSRETT